MGAVWRPVCVGVVAGFQRQNGSGAPSPIPWSEAVFKASKPGSICQPTPLERNPQQVGGDIYPRAPALPSWNFRLEGESGRGNPDRKAGQRSTFKIYGLALINQPTYLPSLWAIPPNLDFFFVFPFILLMKNKKTHLNLRAQNAFLPLPRSLNLPPPI